MYATYTNRGGVEYYRFNGRAWKRIDSAIVDVKILPKKNIDNSIIYRIPSKATAYIVQGVGNYAPLEDYTPDNYEIITELVDRLPAVLKLTELDGTKAYLYIVRETGIAYGDIGGGPMTIGNIFLGEDGYDCGWSTDITTEAGIGIFAGVTETLQYTYNGTSWNVLADDKYLDTTLFDTISAPAEYIGDTLTWDGSVEDRVAFTSDASSDELELSMGLDYVLMSESVPTYEDIMNNDFRMTLTTGQIATPGETRSSCKETDDFITINIFDAFINPYVMIAKHSNCVVTDAVTLPQAGVYFVKLRFSTDAGDYSEEYVDSFKLDGYNFLSTSASKKQIKPELLPIDDLELISIEDIDEICGTTYEIATVNEVTF